jgi:hypothetical protein
VAFSDPNSGYLTQWYTGSAGGASTVAGASAVSIVGGQATVAGIDGLLAVVPAGNISGTVTDATTGQPLANVCVYLYRPGDSTAAAYATCTQADGSYAVYGVTPGQYDVAFFDPNLEHAVQWHDGTVGGAATQSAAVAVTVPGGNHTLAGVNAALVVKNG